jgi:hypothetical protein
MERMNRRDFFKRAGVGVVAVPAITVASPSVWEKFSKWLSGHRKVVAYTTDGSATWAKTTKLKATWTIEPPTDLLPIWGVDSETELRDSIVQAITKEIDAQIVGDLYDVASRNHQR